ncbi:pfs domain-containing protein [Colletotrichum orchidophilum]|uniref:Pfs domain-containing protein n=1 Tax=Colletotrichum orchidophilum TaxID=1209926 RepID=A0A1G4BEF7_9PEZI|nr:pfs domain-containing protein [Colletotrichum orchidophilum]OHE99692.1 pfs domain-containing protein [Colletotrichum orchidophilum]
MEVVGAVASFIAIGQAVGGARHIVHIARAIPGIESEMRWLHNEVEALRLIKAQIAQEGAVTDGSKCETPLLEIAMLQLTDSTRSLEEICKRCTRAVDADGKVKVKKGAWLWLQSELSDCRRKAREARDNLQIALLAVNNQSIKQVALRVESIELRPNRGLLQDTSGPADHQESSTQTRPTTIDDMEEPEAPELDSTPQQVAEDSKQDALARLQSFPTIEPSTPESSHVVVKTSAFLRKVYREQLQRQGQDIGDIRVPIPELAMLQSSPATGSADALAYMLQLWEDQIRNDNFDVSWFYKAHNKIETSLDLPDETTQLLRRVLSAGEDYVNASQTPLHDAVSKNDIDGAVRAAADYNWAINQWNYDGQAPIHIAAIQGHLDIIKQLVRSGCNVNEVNWQGRTALMLASVSGHVLTVQYLIDAGSFLDATGRTGRTAMAAAAKEGHNNQATIIHALIFAGASIKINDQGGYNAIHYLTSSNNEACIIRKGLKILLEAGSDIESRTHWGVTPLFLAIERGDLAGVQCLIEAGAKTTTTCSTWMGFNLLHQAAFFGTTETIRYLSTLNLARIDTEMLDLYKSTPWRCFIYSLHMDDWDRTRSLQPTPEREEAFVSLLKSIRDRNLIAEKERLTWLRQYLKDRDHRGATAALSPLIKHSEEWKQYELLGTYKTIGLQIREQMWEAAVESVDEVVDTLREKMAASPWDTESRYDPETDTDSDEGESDQTESVESENEDWEINSSDEEDEL